MRNLLNKIRSFNNIDTIFKVVHINKWYPFYSIGFQKFQL